MKELSRHLQTEFNVATPGEVTWSHAVNSRAKLSRFLNNPDCMIIESDIRLSAAGKIPVAAHPPETESDLTFEHLIEQMRQSNQGLKLDFKDPEILIPCLKLLQANPLPNPVILNADVVQGNNANRPKFHAAEFISLCQEYYPAGILSLGWTTTANPEDGYSTQNVAEMLTFCKDLQIVTFPVRACLLPASWDNLQPLLQPAGYTLSIWNNEPVDQELKSWMETHTKKEKTFYDLIDENKDPIPLKTVFKDIA